MPKLGECKQARQRHCLAESGAFPVAHSGGQSGFAFETQEGINESLSMQVDELASLDKIQEVASEKGLTYNNDNIKNVE